MNDFKIQSMMKQYIKPVTELSSSRLKTAILAVSGPEGSQIKDDFMSKKNDSFFDTSNEYDENAWAKGFSVWEE